MNRYLAAALTALVLLLLYFAFGPLPAAATEAPPKCVTFEKFGGMLAKHGGTMTALPEAAYTKARTLLDRLSATAKPSDAASLMEMPDGSGGVLYASKGCIVVLLPLPPNIPAAVLKKYLLSEPVKAPARFVIDPFGRLDI